MDDIPYTVLVEVNPQKVKSRDYEHHKKDIITVFMALQKQSYVLGNSLKNLVDLWPHEEIFLIHSSKGIPI